MLRKPALRIAEPLYGTQKKLAPKNNMNNKQSKECYSLKDIADWQMTPDESEVELPTLQRGFVWKPKQIEDLWDSILRGYPIGSFLFSKTVSRYYLMDGQQRATSIFLGFNNPYTPIVNTEAWSIKGELPVVWIDIKPETISTSSKYLIRLTTRSHPWGYQARNNQNKLSTSNRRKALSLFKKHIDNTEIGYTNFSNATTFPYDSSFPLPLSFLIESNTIEEIINKAELYLPEYISTQRGPFGNKKEFINLLKTDLRYDLSVIFENVNKLDNVKIKFNTIDERVLNEENNDANPTLFVRINSSGSALTGDDLIYSIYKSIYPESKTLIENVALNFIKPTQVLSLVSRITASDSDGKTFVKKMNVIDFQRRIKDEDFKFKLGEMISNRVFESLFSNTLNILSCKDNPLFSGEVPPVVIKQAIKKKQDLFLFLLYWLHNHSIDLTNDIKLKIASKFFTFAFFEFSNIKRLWKEYIEDNKFWEKPINNLMWWDNNDGIHFLINPNLLKDYYSQQNICDMFKTNNEHRWGLWEEGVGEKIITYYKNIKNQDFELLKSNEFFWKFITVLRNNRQLILLAQRDYINKTFGDYNQMDSVEDTNAPWDWDHIYPSEWVYNMKRCNKGIRDWINTNGNYRAISLEDNRSRGNTQAPCDIIDVNERDSSFLMENDWEYWINIDKRIWDDKINNHFNAITLRMINIYAKFWNDFKLNDFIDNEVLINE
jgi:hypothetical protein